MYPRISIPCLGRIGLEPGDKLQAHDDHGRVLGLVDVIANDPAGCLVLELGADCAPALRDMLLPPGVR